MRHKQRDDTEENPYAIEYLRGAAAESVGGLMAGFTLLKATVGDAVMDRGYLFDAMARSFDLAIRGLGWYAELLPNIEVKKDRMLEMAGSYWAQATDVAGALVREKGLPSRTSHQIVGILVHRSYEDGRKPADTTPEHLDEAAVEYMGKPVGLSDDVLRRALDPRQFVNGRTIYGGPAPAECRLMAAESRAELDDDRAATQQKRARLAEAAEKLERAIDALVA